MSEEMSTKAESEDIYPAPLLTNSPSSTRSDTTSVLRSLSHLLSRMKEFRCIALLSLDQDGHTARLYALTAKSNVSATPIARIIEFNNATLALALERQSSIHIPRISDEFDSIPGLIDLASLPKEAGAHILPLLAPGGRQGLLIFLTDLSTEGAAQRLALMNSVAVLVSKLFEALFAPEAAES